VHPIILETTFGGWLAQPWGLDSYSFFIILGYAVGMALAMRQMRREQENPSHIIDMGFWALLSGLIGGRLAFILTDLSRYTGGTDQQLRFWEGGFVWYGSFFVGALTLAVYCRRVGISFAKVGDICITYMAFSAAVGRLGCFFAGCCYGKPTSGDWGVSFPVGTPAQVDQAAARLISDAEASLPVYPTQLFESAAQLALFVLLVYLSPRKRFHGQLLLTWLLGYSLLRLLIEVYRGDAVRGIWLWGLSTSQWISIGAATLSASWIAWRILTMKPSSPEAAP